VPTFGSKSRERLATVQAPLVIILERAIVHFDFTVLTGRRGPEDQAEAVRLKRSKAQWPDSAHNCAVEVPGVPRRFWKEDTRALSRAVDVAPWPIDWGNEGSASRRAEAISRFAFLNGLLKGIAAEMGIEIRQGHDWDGDGVLNSRDPDSSGFMDWPHTELVKASPWRL